MTGHASLSPDYTPERERSMASTRTKDRCTLCKDNELEGDALSHNCRYTQSADWWAATKSARAPTEKCPTG